MKKHLLIIGLFLGLNVSAQKHYYWSANSNNSLYGRVIDIREVAPNVLALQTFSLDNNYKFKKAQLSLFDLSTKKESDYTFLTSYSNYRGGFGALSDGSFVINTMDEKNQYELINYKYNAADFKLDVVGRLMGQFIGVPGGIAVFKENGYVTASSMINANKEVKNQLFIKNPGNNFGINGQENGINMLMKSSFINVNHDFSTKAKEEPGNSLSYQVIANKNGKIINYTANDDGKDNYELITGYSSELKEEWVLEFKSLGAGFKPIAMTDGEEWFLTTYDGNHNTTILQYSDGKKVNGITNINANRIKKIASFEANGSFVLKNNDLCVYGFQQTSKGNVPAFYTLNPTTLEIKKSWELKLEDQPCQEFSKLAQQDILLPGKFYSATQLSDGSVVFGGHLISNSAVKDATTSEQTTFNYLMVMPSEFFK
jgi:hypothetical protein